MVCSPPGITTLTFWPSAARGIFPNSFLFWCIMSQTLRFLFFLALNDVLFTNVTSLHLYFDHQMLEEYFPILPFFWSIFMSQTVLFYLALNDGLFTNVTSVYLGLHSDHQMLGESFPTLPFLMDIHVSSFVLSSSQQWLVHQHDITVSAFWTSAAGWIFPNPPLFGGCYNVTIFVLSSSQQWLVHQRDITVPAFRTSAAGGMFPNSSRFYVSLGQGEEYVDDTYSYDVMEKAWYRGMFCYNTLGLLIKKIYRVCEFVDVGLISN